MKINTNITSLNTQRHLGSALRSQSATTRRLSSGDRIYQAGDDPSGLAISENLRSRVRSMRQSNRNVSDAISIFKYAEGSISNISDLVVRLKELALFASNDTCDQVTRANVNNEFQQLKREVEKTAQSARYNGLEVLSAKKSNLEFQIGIGNEPYYDRLIWDLKKTWSTLGNLKLASLNTLTRESSRQSLAPLDNALTILSEGRSTLGSYHSRLLSTSENLSVTSINLDHARSRIKEADAAKESAEAIKKDIITKAATISNSHSNTNSLRAIKLINETL